MALGAGAREEVGDVGVEPAVAARLGIPEAEAAGAGLVGEDAADRLVDALAGLRRAGDAEGLRRGGEVEERHRAADGLLGAAPGVGLERGQQARHVEGGERAEGDGGVRGARREAGEDGRIEGQASGRRRARSGPGGRAPGRWRARHGQLLHQVLAGGGHGVDGQRVVAGRGAGEGGLEGQTALVGEGAGEAAAVGEKAGVGGESVTATSPTGPLAWARSSRRRVVSPGARKSGRLAWTTTGSRTSQSSVAWPTPSAVQATAISRTVPLKSGSATGARTRPSASASRTPEKVATSRSVGGGARKPRPAVAAGAQAAGGAGEAVDQPAVDVAHLDAEPALAEVVAVGVGGLEAGQVQDADVDGGDRRIGLGARGEAVDLQHGVGSGARGSASSGPSKATARRRGPGSTGAQARPMARAGLRPAATSIGRISVAVT